MLNHKLWGNQNQLKGDNKGIDIHMEMDKDKNLKLKCSVK